MCALHRGVRNAAHPSSSPRAQLVNCTQRGETSRFKGGRWEGAWSKNGRYFCCPSYPAAASVMLFSLPAYLKSIFLSEQFSDSRINLTSEYNWKWECYWVSPSVLHHHHLNMPFLHFQSTAPSHRTPGHNEQEGKVFYQEDRGKHQ